MSDAIPPVSILIVDDNPAKLFALAATLEGLDIEIITATSGTEALRQLIARDFAVVLLDVNMPIMNGFETAEMIRLRPRSEHLPILFITSEQFSDDARLKGYDLGAVDYILSPVLPQVIHSKVSVFVELYRLRRQSERYADEVARKNRLIANHNALLEEQVKARTAKLRENEARYRTLFEYAPYGVAIADPRIHCLDANAALCQMVGYSRDDLIGHHASEILDPKEIPNIAPALTAIKAQSPYQREWRLRRKDGSAFLAEASMTLMPDGNLLLMILDLTERKQIEDDIRDQLDELLRWQAVTLGRENRIQQIKTEVNELLAKQGQPPRYANPAS